MDVCGVGYLVQGLEEIENEMSSEQFVKIKLFVKITGSQPISIRIVRFADIQSQAFHFEYFGWDDAEGVDNRKNNSKTGE